MIVSYTNSPDDNKFNNDYYFGQAKSPMFTLAHTSTAHGSTIVELITAKHFSKKSYLGEEHSNRIRKFIEKEANELS